MKLALTSRAYADLESIRDFLIERHPQGAENVRSAIDDTLQLLVLHPKLGRIRPRVGVRSLGIPRFPYTMYYRIEADTVVVVHIRDDRRKPPVRRDV